MSDASERANGATPSESQCSSTRRVDFTVILLNVERLHSRKSNILFAFPRLSFPYLYRIEFPFKSLFFSSGHGLEIEQRVIVLLRESPLLLLCIHSSLSVPKSSHRPVVSPRLESRRLKADRLFPPLVFISQRRAS